MAITALSRHIELVVAVVHAKNSSLAKPRNLGLGEKMDEKTKKLASSLNWNVVTAYGHGGYHYNPHVSKPVALEPIGEEGGC